jgi:hypothetical protein
MKKMQIKMRSPFLAGMVGIVFAALALLAAGVASAQPLQVLHPTTSSWRYLTDGSDQGAAWQASAFDDSTWPQGLGLFGNENNYPYPIGTTIPGLTPITVYYRTHFTWSQPTFGVVLTGTNYVDDGSIIYLNGVEIARFNMPAGPAAFDTVALGANPGGEPVLLQLQIPLDALTNGNANPLINGDNVIAVEVHQNSATSSDRVHGWRSMASRLWRPALIQSSRPIAPSSHAARQPSSWFSRPRAVCRHRASSGTATWASARS